MSVGLRLEAPGWRVQAATEGADPSAKSWLPPAHGPVASPGTKLLCLPGQRSTAAVRRDRGSRPEGQRDGEHAGERNSCSLQNKSRQQRKAIWRGKVKRGEMKGLVKERRLGVPPGEQRLRGNTTGREVSLGERADKACSRGVRGRRSAG